jgi:hypothetical protein
MTTRKELATIRRRRQKIKFILSVVGGLLLVIAAVFLLSWNSSSQASGLAQTGKTLGDFKLTDTHGKTVHYVVPVRQPAMDIAGTERSCRISLICWFPSS